MIKIISTGSSTAKVIDENGNEIKKVQSVNIKMSPCEFHTATLEVFNFHPSLTTSFLKANSPNVRK